MTKHVIVGAGPIGTATAELLASRGETVVVVTRSGTGPSSDLISSVAMDASNADGLTELATGAAAIYNCANPAYTSWARDWPPIADSLNTAAAGSGAVLVTCSNLYGYGPVNGPITVEQSLAATGTKGRVRADMWRETLARHNAGELRATEARASDYIGAGAQSHLGDRVVPRVLAGKAVRVIGDPDQPHSWTYTGDVADTLVELAANPKAWGRAWHVPTNEPRSQRQVIAELAAMAGVAEVPVKGMPRGMLTAVGAFSPMVRELKETYYQFDAPFLIDDSVTRSELGLTPTAWGEALSDHLQFFAAGQLTNQPTASPTR